VAEHLTREAQCCLHLFDLCRAYRDDPARPQAWAILEEYRIRGAEARRKAELVAQARASAFPLALARRRLIGLIRQRGGLPTRPKKRRPWPATNRALPEQTRKGGAQ
jgi:hypothetical protein